MITEYYVTWLGLCRGFFKLANAVKNPRCGRKGFKEKMRGTPEGNPKKPFAPLNNYF